MSVILLVIVVVVIAAVVVAVAVVFAVVCGVAAVDVCVLHCLCLLYPRTGLCFDHNLSTNSLLGELFRTWGQCLPFFLFSSVELGFK